MMSELKTALTLISIFLICLGIAALTTPKLTCVNGKMYEVKEDMLVSMGKECLPIDKE
jgi:hypothetical protein